MQINLTGHHVEITSSLRDYVTQKIGRLDRHFENVTSVHVILEIEKQRHKAEATMHISGSDLYADAVEDDMYVAIDELADKLDRQMRKHKEKLKDRDHKAPPRRELGT
jgi:putative sigma-54 modulation protein